MYKTTYGLFKNDGLTVALLSSLIRVSDTAENDCSVSVLDKYVTPGEF